MNGQRHQQPRYGPDPESILRVSEHFLSRRQFEECQKYALHVQQSDPNHPGLFQILAVAQTLLLSSQTQQNPPNYYSILDLKPFSTTDRTLLKSKVKTLASLLNPSKNHYPFAKEAFEVVKNGWKVLLNPLKKTQYDDLLRNWNSEKKITFWTVCPYCYILYEYGKVYEGCNLRCQNEKCLKGFRGLAINHPPVFVLNEGNYSGSSWTPFAPVNSYVSEEGGSGIVCGERDFVYISDDSDNLCDGTKKMKSVGLNEEPILERVVMKRRKKSVGRNTKKVMGTGYRVRKHGVVGQHGEGLDLNTPAIDGEANDCEEGVDSAFLGGLVRVKGGGSVMGEAGFFKEGDDDIFVGLDDI